VHSLVPGRILIAIGGNAIHPDHAVGTAEEQLAMAQRTGLALLPILESARELIITHGNGPVVGKILMRQALSSAEVPPMPMDVCVAHSQGGIAYMLMQAFENALRRNGNPRHVVCLLTQVEVDPDDPAFDDPRKPVGFFYDEEEARVMHERLGWTLREDAGRGWRYVVPSPEPRHVADISLVETVARNGAVVIAGGGGGIPVIRDADGARRGVNAVIDKDLTSARMATVLGAETLLILTAIDRVRLDFATPAERALGEVTASELRGYQGQGHFAAGSMAPKVEAALRFVEAGGPRAVIASLDEAVAALAGEAGTQVLRDPSAD
jgi:carbamate kinase